MVLIIHTFWYNEKEYILYEREIKMLDVVIIGAGPAGLTAAIYAKRAGLSCLVIESGQPGGQVLSTYEVDNYPCLPGISGMDLGASFRDHASRLGVDFIEDTVIEVKLDTDIKSVVTTKATYEAKNLIIATGAKHAMLGVDGEESLAGMGVSYCATCDGAFYKDSTVAVVGGGDVAVEDAIYLSRMATKVYLIHRRDSLRAASSLVNQLLALDNVEIIWDTVVDRIDGEDEVSGLSLTNVKSGQSSQIFVEGVFIAVGNVPSSQLYKGQLLLDDKGYIVAGEDCKTSLSGVYAVGDVRTKALRQIITAAADGANAIGSITAQAK